MPDLLQALSFLFLLLNNVNKTHVVLEKCLFSADILKPFYSLTCTGFLQVYLASSKGS